MQPRLSSVAQKSWGTDEVRQEAAQWFPELAPTTQKQGPGGIRLPSPNATGALNRGQAPQDMQGPPNPPRRPGPIPLSRLIGMAYQSAYPPDGPRANATPTPDVRMVVIDGFDVVEGDISLKRAHHARTVCDIVNTLAPGCELYVLPLGQIPEQRPEPLSKKAFACVKDYARTAAEKYRSSHTIMSKCDHSSIEAFAADAAANLVGHVGFKALLLSEVMNEVHRDDARYTLVNMSFSMCIAKQVHTALTRVYRQGAESLKKELEERIHAHKQRTGEDPPFDRAASRILSDAIAQELQGDMGQYLKHAQTYYRQQLFRARRQRVLVFEAAGNAYHKGLAYGRPQDAQTPTLGLGQFVVAAAQEGAHYATNPMTYFSAPGTIATEAPNANAFDDAINGVGTSSASPVLATIVAQIAQAHPNFTPERIDKALKRSAALRDIAHEERDGMGIVSLSSIRNSLIHERPLPAETLPPMAHFSLPPLPQAAQLEKTLREELQSPAPRPQVAQEVLSTLRDYVGRVSEETKLPTSYILQVLEHQAYGRIRKLIDEIGVMR